MSLDAVPIDRHVSTLNVVVVQVFKRVRDALAGQLPCDTGFQRSPTRAWNCSDDESRGDQNIFTSNTAITVENRCHEEPAQCITDPFSNLHVQLEWKACTTFLYVPFA